MKLYLITVLGAAFFLSSCGSSSKDNNAAINDKKVALEKLKGEKGKLDEQIKTLETDLTKLDPASSTAQKAKLVTVLTLASTSFNHFIELQGKIDAEDISFVTPRGLGGLVKAIYIKQGSFVKKGQLLMKLDDAVARQSVAAAKEGLQAIKTQLAFAKDIYLRQKNLWEQNIGTEVQLITAKNNVATLENQLQATEENVKVVQEQLNTSYVYSDVSGIADVVNIKVGETFSAASAANLGIRIVNSSQLKVVGNIPENYLSNVAKGTPVIVQVPDVNKIFNSSLTYVGATIDPLSRGFIVEAKLPADAALKPNQIALLKVKDYANGNAIAIPLATLQNDEKGKFVLVAAKENGKLIARKRPVNIGLLNNDLLEIKTGLKTGDVLITEGFQSLYEGQLITTE
jgi:membrane fusion protein, multidrug efflux system